MKARAYEQRPGHWFVQFRFRGKLWKIYSDVQHRDKIPLRSREHADHLAGRISLAGMSPDFDPNRWMPSQVSAFAFEKAWTQHVEHKANTEAAPGYLHVLKAYGRNHAVPFFRDIDVREITGLTVERFHADLVGKGLSPKYVKNNLDAVEGFLRRLQSLLILDRVPPFPTVRTQEQGIRWIDRSGQDAILGHISSKHHPIFRLMFRHGLRPAEACVLQWRDFSDGVLLVRRTLSRRVLVERSKGRTLRRIPLAPDVLAMLPARGLPLTWIYTAPGSRSGGRYCPDRLRDIFNRARVASGLPEITLYEATRHSVPTMAAARGVPLPVIQKAMGHADIRTTMNYTHVAETDAMRAVYEESNNVIILEEMKGRQDG